MLFMGSLFLRSIQAQQLEPAASAHRVVTWYAARPWTLWALLICLPCVGLAMGAMTLWRDWQGDPELQRAIGALRARASLVLVAGGTAASAAILGIVAFHMLTS
jgi:hypothetical protein